MINTYSSSQNPCGFCSNITKEVPIEKKEDYLQINLDGNDTTLFIRETSVEDIPIVKEEIIKPIEEVVVEVPNSQSIPPEESPPTPVKTEITVEDVVPDDKTARNKQFDQLYFKKWSGKTYFEEELRKIRIQEYQKDLEESIKKRNLWKAFQKELAKERRLDLIRTSGPEWWQEPSHKQICLATSLGDVITADYEEGVTGRTRQWLLDLGVTTRVTPKQVRACMKCSLLDPIDFLLETHSVILKSQLHVKKKRGDLERPFSVNERLLLSAVCVLHLPTLLTMLHYILPPPKPYSTAKHIQELLFGDLDDERVRYSTPYMEPIPFRNRSHFLNWAVDKVFRALLPSMATTDNIVEHKGGSLSYVIPSMKMSIMSAQKPSDVDKKVDNVRFSSDYSYTGDSVTWLIAQCIAKRQLTDSLYPFYDPEDGVAKFFNRKLTKRSMNKQSKQPSGDENDDDINEEVSVSPSFNEGTSGHEIVSMNVHPHFVSFSESTSVNDMRAQTGKESHEYSGETPKTGHIDFAEDFTRKDTNHSQDLSSKHSQRRSTFESTQVSSKSNDKDEISEKEGDEDGGEDVVEEEVVEGVPEETVEPQQSELEKLWNEIAALPKNKQLQHALGVLRGMGDPLARLPKVHTIPTVLRWLELRRGKNRILSSAAKEELLRRSRGMWKLAPTGNVMEGPKVNCSKKVERLLTWDKKKWLGAEIDKSLRKYYPKVKQEKVDNARTFFPTMLNHYDYGSKLNRNFRDVFFTYLPAREADTFVYRPWQPQETNNS